MWLWANFGRVCTSLPNQSYLGKLIWKQPLSKMLSNVFKRLVSFLWTSIDLEIFCFINNQGQTTHQNHRKIPNKNLKKQQVLHLIKPITCGNKNFPSVCNGFWYFYYSIFECRKEKETFQASSAEIITSSPYKKVIQKENEKTKND